MALASALTPLLQTFHTSTTLAYALASISSALGGNLTARHIIPTLLSMAVIPSMPSTPAPLRNTPSTTAGNKPTLNPATTTSHLDPSSQGTSSTAVGRLSRPPERVDPEVVAEQYAALALVELVLDFLPLDFIPRLALASSSVTAVLPLGEQLSRGGATAVQDGRSSRSLDDSSSGKGSSSSGKAGKTGVPLLLPLLSPERFVVVPGGLSRLAKVILCLGDYHHFLWLVVIKGCVRVLVDPILPCK